MTENKISSFSFTHFFSIFLFLFHYIIIFIHFHVNISIAVCCFCFLCMIASHFFSLSLCFLFISFMVPRFLHITKTSFSKISLLCIVKWPVRVNCQTKNGIVHIDERCDTHCKQQTHEMILFIKSPNENLIAIKTIGKVYLYLTWQ